MLGFGYIDLLIIILLIMGIIVGFKRGAVKSFLELILLLCSVVAAFYLKNPISVIIYKHFPIIPFSKIIILNILIYEAIAFILCISLLMIVVKTLLKLSGILDRIIKATIILNLPSRIIGAILGLIQNFIVIFIILFVFSHFKSFSSLINKSKYSNLILNNTPIISKYSKDVNTKFTVLYSSINWE